METEKNRRAHKAHTPHERKRRQAKTRQTAAEWTGESCDRSGRPVATATEPEAETPAPTPTKRKGNRRDDG